MDDPQEVDIMIMSGVEDGLVLSFASVNGDGVLEDDIWAISLGRRDDNDICLRNDTFSSRYHARLYRRELGWYLEDLNSKNGTFVEQDDEDTRVTEIIELRPGQLFRVGRTWLRVQVPSTVKSEFDEEPTSGASPYA